MKKSEYKQHCEQYLARLLRTGRSLLVSSLFIIVLLYGFNAAALGSRDEQEKYDEYKVKAAFLYNFAKFVEWPSETFTDPSESLGLCIIGEDPFGEAIDVIKDKKVKGRKLLIKQTLGSSELKECHIVFISPSEKNTYTDILEITKNRNILTVSDISKFAEHGGMINFKKSRDKIKLEINHEAAKHSGLKMSSKLLRIAKIVKGKN